MLHSLTVFLQKKEWEEGMPVQRRKKCGFNLRRLVFTCIGAITVAELGLNACAFGATGTVVATFPFESYQLLADPSQPYEYATVPSSDALEVINTSTMSIQKTINLAGSPYGMALSPDGKTLYVADNSNNSIDIVNTSTLGITGSLTSIAAPTDVAVGSNNRLFVLDAGTIYQQIQQINSTTGASAGPSLPSELYYSGNLEISPDQNTLYYGQNGLSPTTLFSFDVSSVSNPTLINQTETGSNGRNVKLSHNGEWIAQPNGAPYEVSLLNSTTFSSIGTFNTGPYPDDMAFSPDDKYAYIAVEGANTVQVYDMSTFGQTASFQSISALVPAETTDLETDASGRYLFASFQSDPYIPQETIVYDTGYSVPEPSMIGLLVLLPLLNRRAPFHLRAKR